MERYTKVVQLETVSALLKKAQWEEAEEMASRAIASDPHSAKHWFLLGVARHQQKRPEAALAAMEHALAIDPDLDDACLARATLLLALKRTGAALAELKALVRRHPRNAKYQIDFAIVLEESGENDMALQYYDAALRQAPRDFRGLLNRAALLVRLGHPEMALHDNLALAKCYVGSAVAHYNLGDNFLCLHRYDEALQTFARVLKLDPNHVQARLGKGLALSMLSRFGEAQAEIEHGQQIDAHQAAAYFERAAGAAGSPVGRTPEKDPPLIYIHGVLLDMASCMWQRRIGLLAEIERLRADPSPPELHDRSLGFNLLALPLAHDAQRDMAKLVAATVKPPALPFNPVRRHHDRLRIGYLSPDYRAHPAARIHWRQMQLHDRQRFEVIALSLHPGDNGLERDRIVSSCDRFIELFGLDMEAAVARVALEEIDILVDIGGYADFARPELLAARVAPINVQHLGIPLPCGCNFVDYRLTDAIMIPPEDADRWDEQLVWLPNTSWVYDETLSLTSLPGRAACGLPESGFVFCCFNRHFKIEPDVFDVWMRLLRHVPGSVFWLLDDTLTSAGNLRREAQARGVDPHRLVFAPRLDFPEHLSRHACADLFLDTFYCNAHTTASDALFAGLPVLTLYGRTMASRFCASLVLTADLPELVVHDRADYEARALHLARNHESLIDIRNRLESGRLANRLFDMPRRTREIEAAYLEMWQRHEAGLAPEGFAVPPVSMDDR